MTDEKIPQVILLPGAQAQVDADPKLAKALGGLKESLLNAMQGVQDGRYKSFDDAMEAMTGSRPEAIPPPHPPRHGYYLATMPNPKGPGFMAVISDGSPQMGHDPVEIMDMDRFDTLEDARAWFEARCVEMPYENDDEK